MASQTANQGAGDCAAHATINFCALGRFIFAANVIGNYDA
jgi:hypothetical protein